MTPQSPWAESLLFVLCQHNKNVQTIYLSWRSSSVPTNCIALKPCKWAQNLLFDHRDLWNSIGVLPHYSLSVQLFSDYLIKFPRTSEIVRQDFNVDDLLTGDSTIETTIQLKSDIKGHSTLWLYGALKWYSSDLDVICDIPDDQHEPYIILNDNEIKKTLDILCDPTYPW